MSYPKQKPKTLSLSEALDLGRRRHQAGALTDAQKLYELVLEAQPNNTDALTLLASIAFRLGQEEKGCKVLDQAIELYSNTVRERPWEMGALAPLVNFLLARNRTAEAEEKIRRLEFPLIPVRASEEAFEERRRRAIAAGRPSMVITTVPKSASESIWNKLAEGLDLGQCHLALGLFPDCCLMPSRVRTAAEGGLIVKEHILATPHNLQTLREHGIDRIVVQLRDPRQALLSWVHFVRDDVNQRLLAPLWRKIVPAPEVFEQPLEQQIDWGIERYLPYLIDFAGGWKTADDAEDSGLQVHFATFEHFRTDPEAYIAGVLDFYGIDRADFRSDAEAEVVHLRKGQIDEWREVFTPAQKAAAWARIPEEMAAQHGWTP